MPGQEAAHTTRLTRAEKPALPATRSFKERTAPLFEDLAIGFAAVPHGGDMNGFFILGVKENAVIATAEAEAGERRFESLHVAGVGGKVMINAVKNL
jgi:hypothetical protein